MLIPRFWAEARRQHRANKRSLTLRRMGWSSQSPQLAQEHAEQRVDEALVQALKEWPGKQPRRLDHKVSYNGAEGLPIREEIIEEREEGVITRNSYGALCLNTPDVLFVDVDNDTVARMGKGVKRACVALALLVMVALRLGLAVPEVPSSVGSGVVGVLGLSLIFWILAKMAWSGWVGMHGRALGFAVRAVENECCRDPTSRWRVYKTPNGARILALHRVFDPQDDTTQALMRRLHVDPLYARMCLRQACFRARVSPKPWRMEKMERLRGPVWPVEGAALARRQEWVARYEVHQGEYAACRWVENIGQGPLDDRAQAVMQWHDQMCQAQTNKPLA